MTNNIDTKQTLYKYCIDFINKRLVTIQNQITDIQNSLFLETKSSSGDKHETGRAMLKLEREKTGQQLAEIQKLNEVISKIDIIKKSNFIGIGSLVYTTGTNYFIAISAGEIKIKNEIFYCVSASTPIGQLLIGKKEGEVIVFKDQSFRIIEFL